MQILNFVPNSKYLENVAAMNEGIAIVEGIKQFEDFSLCRYKLSLLNKNTVFIFRNDPSNYVQFYTKAVKPLSLSNLLIDEVARSRMNK